MKIFVKQLQTSLDLNSEVFELATKHIKAINSLIIPINDHKAKLQLNAQYMAATANEFWDFYRIFNAYSIVLGAIALVSERIYRIKKGTEEHKSLTTEELVSLPEFKAYIKTEEFANIMNQIHTMGDTSDLVSAYSEIRTLSRKLSNELQTDEVARNVAMALNLSDKACKAITAPLRITNQWNERYLSIHIVDSKEKVIIHFHGSDEEYELLDNWLSTPELKLKTVDGENAWEIQDKESFVKWFNLLRTRLESECSYQTILTMLSDLDASKQKKYIEAIQVKIATISAATSIDINSTRKKVINYLHHLLNSRKGFPVKHYNDFTAEDLSANWDKGKNIYVLSLYQ